MKAIVQDGYGSADVLELRDVDEPVPGDDEVLVRVRTAGVNAADWHFMTGLPYIARLAFGLVRPKCRIQGRDVAGRVEAVGANVTRFRPGDEVFGWCEGSFAEYVCAGEDNLVAKPADLSFEQAAAVPMAAFTALHALRDQGGVRSGHKLLMIGASGGIGSFAVQIAKSFGADVTGVCSTENTDLVRSIGADRVIDYTREDFTRGEERYDVILDIPANRSLSDCRRVLTPEGTYVLVGGPDGRWLGPLARVFGILLLSPFVRQRLRTFVSKENNEDLVFLTELIESGKVTPVVGRTCSLPEVPDAIRYVGEGHVRGNVVVNVSG